MTRLPRAEILEAHAVAAWLDVDVDWVLEAVTGDDLPILGVRSDGVPLMATCEIQLWLRRPTLADDET